MPLHSLVPDFLESISSRRRVLAVAVLLGLAAAGTAQAVAPGAPAGAVLRYNQVSSGPQQQASVAAAADGNAVAVWYSRPDSGAGPAGVRARLLDSAGAPAGAEILVNDIAQAGSVYHPSVATDADGNFVVVWSASSTQLYSLTHVHMRRFDRNGVPLGPQQQIDTAVPEAGGAVVARSADGRYVVAWDAYPASGAEIRARRFDAAGNALGGEITVAVRGSGYAGPDLSIATDDSGAFTVVWTHDTGNGADYDVFRRRFDAYGIAQGPVQRVNTAYAGGQRVADIAMDAAGNSVVVWDSYINRNDSRVLGQRYGANGAAVGGEFVLAYKQGYPAEEPTRPSVAMARASGDFSVSWQRRSSTIYVRSYAANGTARSSEQLISDGTAGAAYAQIAADADGDATVVWQNAESSWSNDFGVVGRRIAAYASVDLAARLQASVQSATAPTLIGYQIGVDNLQMPSPVRGMGTAGGIVAVLTPPAGGVVLSAGGSGWQCDTTVPAPRCSYAGFVAPGAGAPALLVEVGGVPAGVAQASVQVSGGQPDANAGNDGAAAEVVLP
ncbi:hypothetical protein [Tahibacter harae]|uniref:Uncharacterized protein n=1 Tax=Tahibacter harae TaxID=2963937 RepID=A0ABT1QQS1_9GAMM|nr:hypothetical protein [Tahibacter harae]MCQ4164640.1 hypothetical protein [Tahibacter harae]